MGFSSKAAESMSAMTTITLEEKYTKPDAPERGAITIQEYIENLVHNAEKSALY